MLQTEQQTVKFMGFPARHQDFIELTLDVRLQQAKEHLVNQGAEAVCQTKYFATNQKHVVYGVLTLEDIDAFRVKPHASLA